MSCSISISNLLQIISNKIPKDEIAVFPKQVMLSELVKMIEPIVMKWDEVLDLENLSQNPTLSVTDKSKSMFLY